MENEASIKQQNEEKSAGKKLAFTCPFCREPIPTSSGEEYARIQARCLKNDHMAFTLKGFLYQRGEGGIPKDDLKALVVGSGPSISVLLKLVLALRLATPGVSE